MADLSWWSDNQRTALSMTAFWLKTKHAPFFYLGGYAGTGKTTIAKHLAAMQDGRVRYAAFTGKAAKVMRAAGCAGAKTIHSLIYKIEEHPDGSFTMVRNPSALDGVDLVVVDECSMVDEDLGRDLLSFGVPVLALGDPGQLPPVRGAGYFTSGKPHFMLTEIHRQAADSPIIRLATDIRNGDFRRETLSQPGLTICGARELDPELVTAAGTVIVGRNRTRHSYNKRLREIHGFRDEFPMAGETVICLRNDKFLKVFNGEIFQVTKRTRGRTTQHGKVIGLHVVDPDADQVPAKKVAVYEHFFQGDERSKALPVKALKNTQQFDFGYAITCHKSQGSQWPNVCVFDESSAFREDASRWLYTAATRASEHLTLVI